MKKREKWSESSFLIEQSQDNKNSLSSDAGEEDPDFGLRKTFKKRKQIQKKQPAVDLNLDRTRWNETVSLVVDKHGISDRGLTEMMSAVVSSGVGSINDLSLSKIQCVDIAIGYESKLPSQYLRKLGKNSTILTPNITDIYCIEMGKCSARYRKFFF